MEYGTQSCTKNSIFYLIVLNHNSTTRMINKHANQMVFFAIKCK